MTTLSGTAPLKVATKLGLHTPQLMQNEGTVGLGRITPADSVNDP